MHLVFIHAVLVARRVGRIGRRPAGQFQGQVPCSEDAWQGHALDVCGGIHIYKHSLFSDRGGAGFSGRCMCLNLNAIPVSAGVGLSRLMLKASNRQKPVKIARPE
jgi:hypothetical protein